MEKTTLPALEVSVIEYWNKIDAPNKIIEKTKTFPKKFFLDGPPFATGTMHYGHILVSTLKDTMTRYLTMRGFNIDRGNGWDCHGVPIEMLAKKVIGYATKAELLEYGIEKHNDVCRNLVLKCADQWYKDFDRIGRWIDRKSEYKTMDPNFMESVLWVFKKLYDAGLIYEGYKVMPYSTGCATPLSHFEAKQNYKAVTEMSITVCFGIVSTKYSKFKHADDHPTYILVWTTTPWTLPNNLALCTFVKGTLVHLFDNQLQCYVILSKTRYESTYCKLKYQGSIRFKLIGMIDSMDILNAEYKPPFEYFWFPNCQEHLSIGERAFRVMCDAYVKDGGDDSGTGFVHLAPCYGEDDFRVCCENNIVDAKNSKGNLIDIIDDDGCFVNNISDYAGMYVKKADPLIIKNLRSRNLLFDSKMYTHQYPHCYRTDTPLLYKMVSAWFINASDEKFREKMLTNNKKINWMPPNVGENHFDNWLQGSVDWCISRSRYWGTPIPIWKSDDGCESVCIGSIKELEQLSGITGIKDLHIETIDSIKVPSREGRGMLKRVEGVLDCWFESGAMPYGQLHYPFENRNSIDNNREFIADFITESKDQTRGWFYTLMVLATALFNKPAFQNVIVTGIINGVDGQKMSKSKGNYSDPNILLDKYGADTCRLYLLSTPVVKAESIKFDESVLARLQQNTVAKIYHMANFLDEKLKLYNLEFPDNPITYPTKDEITLLENILDRWIINKTRLLLQSITKDMDQYKISSIAHKICLYTEQLTNWYLRMARERLKGNSDSSSDWRNSLQTLLFVMTNCVKIMAPFLPFISETVYQMLGCHFPNKLESVHFEKYPATDNFICDDSLEHKFDIIQKVIILIRDLRDVLKLAVKRPLACVEIGCFDVYDWEIIQDILDYIKTESNVLKINNLDAKNLVNCTPDVNISLLSLYLKEINQIKNMKHVMSFINNMTNEQMEELKQNKYITEPTFGIVISDKFVCIRYRLKNPSSNVKASDTIVVRVDTNYSENVRNEHMIRLINKEIQEHRKKILLKPWQNINVCIHTNSSTIKDFIFDCPEKFCGKNLNKIYLSDEDRLLPNITSHQIMDEKLLISSELI